MQYNHSQHPTSMLKYVRLLEVEHVEGEGRTCGGKKN